MAAAEYQPTGTLGDGVTCLYRQRNRAGECVGLLPLDSRTISPLLDCRGQPPGGNGPAYVQMVNGLPWNWLTRDDLVIR